MPDPFEVHKSMYRLPNHAGVVYKPVTEMGAKELRRTRDAIRVSRNLSATRAARSTPKPGTRDAKAKAEYLARGGGERALTPDRASVKPRRARRVTREDGTTRARGRRYRSMRGARYEDAARARYDRIRLAPVGTKESNPTNPTHPLRRIQYTLHQAGQVGGVTAGATVGGTAGGAAYLVGSPKKVEKKVTREEAAATGLGAVSGGSLGAAGYTAGGFSAKKILARRRMKAELAATPAERARMARDWGAHLASHGVSSPRGQSQKQNVAIFRSYPKTLPDWRAQRLLAVKNNPKVQAGVVGASVLTGGGLAYKHARKNRSVSKMGDPFTIGKAAPPPGSSRAAKQAWQAFLTGAGQGAGDAAATLVRGATAGASTQAAADTARAIKSTERVATNAVRRVGRASSKAGRQVLDDLRGPASDAARSVGRSAGQGAAEGLQPGVNRTLRNVALGAPAVVGASGATGAAGFYGVKDALARSRRKKDRMAKTAADPFEVVSKKNISQHELERRRANRTAGTGVLVGSLGLPVATMGNMAENLTGDRPYMLGRRAAHTRGTYRLGRQLGMTKPEAGKTAAATGVKHAGAMLRSRPITSAGLGLMAGGTGMWAYGAGKRRHHEAQLGRLRAKREKQLEQKEKVGKAFARQVAKPVRYSRLSRARDVLRGGREQIMMTPNGDGYMIARGRAGSWFRGPSMGEAQLMESSGKTVAAAAPVKGRLTPAGRAATGATVAVPATAGGAAVAYRKKKKDVQKSAHADPFEVGVA